MKRAGNEAPVFLLCAPKLGILALSLITRTCIPPLLICGAGPAIPDYSLNTGRALVLRAAEADLESGTPTARPAPEMPRHTPAVESPTPPVRPMGILRGTVTTPDNTPLPYAHIHVLGANLGAVADSTGMFRIDSVPAGDWTVKAFHPGHESTEARVALEAKRSLTLELHLKPAGMASDINTGHVTRLYAGRPNPYQGRGGVTLGFSLGLEGQAIIEVFNVSGRLVRTIVDDRYGAGDHEILWDGTGDSGEGVASGMYFYRLKTDGAEYVRKIVVIGGGN